MGTFSAKMTLKDRYWFGGFSGTPPSEPNLSTPPPPRGFDFVSIISFKVLPFLLTSSLPSSLLLAPFLLAIILSLIPLFFPPFLLYFLISFQFLFNYFPVTSFLSSFSLSRSRASEPTVNQLIFRHFHTGKLLFLSILLLVLQIFQSDVYVVHSLLHPRGGHSHLERVGVCGPKI